MQPIRGRTSIEDNSLCVDSVVRPARSSSANSLEGADFRSLYTEERRRRKQLEEELKLLKIRLKRTNEQRYKKNVVCAKCWKQEGEKVGNIKEDFQSFSELMDVRIGKKYGSYKTNIVSEDDRRTHELDLIENLSIFGLPEESILNFAAESEQEGHMEGQIVMSVRPATNSVEHAAKFVFPSGMAVKRITGGKIVQRVTELMTKSYTRQNSFLLSLKEEPGRLDHLSEDSRKLIELLNPSKKLFFVCIGTYDFTYMSKGAESFSMTSISSNQIQDMRICSSEIIPNVSDISGMQILHEVGMTQRVYCITSYLPFFSFFEDVMLSILNIVKVQRLEVYKHQINDIKEIDSRFQIARVKQIYEDTIKKFNRQKIRLDSIYTLKFLNETVTLPTASSMISYLPIEQWLPQIISIFTLDNFMDLLTLFLLEDHLVFVCENSHILTYSIYLFVEYLYRPIGFAFESVYIVPSEEFLNAPFPVVLGLLKKKKWVDENRIIQRFNVHTYVFIGPAGINFVYGQGQSKKEKLRRRPQKLKSLLTPFFRELEKSKKTNKKYTKTEQVHQYMYHSTKEERQCCLMIMDCVKKYLEQQVSKWIPSKQQMLELKKKIQSVETPKNKDAHTYLIDSVIAHIIEQRKQRDPFFEQILLTQSLNMFISKRCGYS